MEETLENFLVAVAPGIAWTAVGQPFDLVRVRLAASGQFTGVVDCLRTTIRHEGFSAFWKGTTPALLISLPTSFVMFGTYNAFRPATPCWEEQRASYWAQVYSAGAIAGMPLTLFQNPLDVWRTRAQTNRASVSSVAPLASAEAAIVTRAATMTGTTAASSASSAIGSNGSSSVLRGLMLGDRWLLMRGFPLLVARNIGCTGLYFSFYELTTALAARHGWFGGAENRALVCGGVVGVAFTLLTHPLEVVRTNLMNTDSGGVVATTQRLLSGKGGVSTSAGWRALYRGVGVATTKALPVNAAGLWTLAVAQSWVDERRRVRRGQEVQKHAAGIPATSDRGGGAEIARRKTLLYPSGPPVVCERKSTPK